MIMAAVRVGFGYFQREAGYTRTGSHHAKVGGRETGQWHEAELGRRRSGSIRGLARRSCGDSRSTTPTSSSARSPRS